MQGHGGFTLVELLTSIGIILLLMALLFPAASRVRTRHAERRTFPTSGNSWWHVRFMLPTTTTLSRQVGHPALPANADDYLWTSYSNCWKPLTQLASALAANNSCLSVREGYSDADELERFNRPMAGLTTFRWAGSIGAAGMNCSVGGSLKYRSLHRFHRSSTRLPDVVDLHVLGFERGFSALALGRPARRYEIP